VKPERVLSDIWNARSLGLNSFSLAILVGLLGIVCLLVAGGIVLPLWLGQGRALSVRTRSKLRDLSYFISIGVGYILLEIALLNRFSLHLGHPTHSLRVVLFSLLLASGLGSLLSGRVRSERGCHRLLVAAGLAVAILVAVYALLLGRLVDGSIGWTFAARATVAVALVAPLGLLMGVMLPTGVRLVTGRHTEIIPWAWGLNGAASVLGSVLAMVLAIHLGFTVTLLAGGAMYLLAVLAGARGAGAPNGLLRS
jgi:hypothetical protein